MHRHTYFAIAVMTLAAGSVITFSSAGCYDTSCHAKLSCPVEGEGGSGGVSSSSGGSGGGLSGNNGSDCVGPEECDSGQCVEGVCCDAVCEDACYSCAAAGFEGTCSPAAEGSDPKDACNGEASCDGAGACAYGKHIFSSGFGGTGSSDFTTIADVAVDSDGNVIVVGKYRGTVNFGGGQLISAGSAKSDIFVAKFDGEGTHLWSYGYGDAEDQFAEAVAVDVNGNILVTGRTKGTLNLGGDNLFSVDATDDIFIASFLPNGTHGWSYRYPVTGSAVGITHPAIATDEQGNVLFSVQLIPLNIVNFGLGDIQGTGLWSVMAKFSNTGATMWTRVFEPQTSQASWCVASAIVAASNGSIYVSGYFKGAVDFGSGTVNASSEISDGFVAKLDGNGNGQWSTAFASPDEVWIRALVPTSDGGIVAQGRFKQSVAFGGYAFNAYGNFDIFLARFSAAGLPQWAHQFGSAEADHARAVAVTDQDDLLVTGVTFGSVDLGGGELVPTGTQGAFVGRFKETGDHIWSKMQDVSSSGLSNRIAAGKDRIAITGDYSGTPSLGGSALPSFSAGSFLAIYGP